MALLSAAVNLEYMYNFFKMIAGNIPGTMLKTNRKKPREYKGYTTQPGFQKATPHGESRK